MRQADMNGIGFHGSSTTGVVGAGSAESVAAGIGILERGGNAADAAVATLLVLMVTDHLQCSIGGEVPLMIYDAKTQGVKVLSGQGRAPLSQGAIDWYMQHGIPGEGDMKMAPVPSVVDLCTTTLKRYGTMGFADVAGPTLELLDAGDEAWHPRLAETLRKLVDSEQKTAGTRESKLQAASDRFYGRSGQPSDVADDLEAFYVERGGFLRKADLAAHLTTIEDPVTVDYRGYTVCKCGPWTQGPYLNQALRLLEGFDVKGMGHLSGDYVHVVTEALKLAMADRDEYYGDPDFVGVPLSLLLSDTYTEMRRPLIDMKRASHEARPGDPYLMQPVKEGGVFRPAVGGTTTCVVADRWGNVVAATPSANVDRNHIDGGRTGVTYGNRLLSFNTTPGHPNCIQAGKRPRITLTPTLVLKEGRPVMAVSVAGQDLQDQVTLQLLLDVIEFGMNIEQAVSAPRFATLHHQDSFDPNPDRARTYKGVGGLLVNGTLDEGVQADLAGRGHSVAPQRSEIARPVMIYLDQETKEMQVAGDPAALRHAAGVG